MKTSSELTLRVVTALFGVALLLALILLTGRLGMALIAVVIALGMVYEFVSITFSLPDKKEKRGLLLGVTWLVAFFAFLIPRAEYEMLIASFLGLFCYFLFTAERHKDDASAFATHFRELIYAMFGLLYLGFLPLFFVLIRDSANGMHWTLVFLFVVWAGDTGAYFAGKSFGRRKLYPAISPKKTVEGAIGGLLSGLVVAILYKVLLFRSMSWGAVVTVSLLVGVVAQIGDLCESYLKRAFDTKDSGSILPGHGGFLDRFDGVVFSLPVMYGCIRIFG